MRTTELRPMALAACVLTLIGLVGCGGGSRRADVSMPDAYTLVGPKHFVQDFPATNEDGSLNVVVGNPTGANAQWYVEVRDGSLRRRQVAGQADDMRYLGYPGNLGSVPQTLQVTDDPMHLEPLSALVLGPPALRGSVIRARLVAVLRMNDGETSRPVLIAVAPRSVLGEAEDLASFEAAFPGGTTILETWFRNYRGRDRLTSEGFADAQEARAVLAKAKAAYAGR